MFSQALMTLHVILFLQNNLQSFTKSYRFKKKQQENAPVLKFLIYVLSLALEEVNIDNLAVTKHKIHCPVV